MRNTHSFKMNLPEMSDPVDVRELNDNFLVIDDALMAGLCKKELTTNNMGSSDPASRKYGWAPWLEIYNGNEFDVVVIDRNAPDLPSGTINIEAGKTHRMFINGTYYMNFYVQDQHDVTFKWFTNAETRINEIEPSGGGGVSSVNVTGASGSHIESSGGPVTDNGTIELNISTGYSIPADNKQTAWDSKAADLKLEINSSTFVITAQLKDASGNLIGNERTIDLPLESVVVSGDYDEQTKKVILTLQNGSTIEFSVADLVSGLQTELNDTDNKLDPTYIAYNASHRAVSDSEKSAWNAKQNAISDLDTIRSGASAGSTAVQPSALETALAGKQNAIDNSHKLSSDLVDDANHTNKFVTSTEKQTWNGKQNAIDSDHKLSSSLVSFTTAEAAALASGIDSSKVAQISTNQSNILYSLNTGVKNKLPCQISQNYLMHDDGLKCNYTEDGTYTVTGTLSASDSYLDIVKIYADKLNGDHVAYISATGTGTCRIAAYGWNGTSYTMILLTDTSQKFNVGNYEYVLFRIRFMDPIGTSYNAVVKAMVCTEDAWNQSHDWQPPALPNYDLTRLQSEDRAALVEVVDEGAKNKFDLYHDPNRYPNPITATGLTATILPDGTVSVTGTPTTAEYTTLRLLDMPASYFRKFNGYYLSGSVAPSGKVTKTQMMFELASSPYTKYGKSEDGNPDVAPLDFPDSSSLVYFFIRIYNADTTTPVNLTFKPMLTTKAKLDVSQNYAPFALPNTDLTKAVATKAPALSTSTAIDSGSLDDVAVNTFAVYASTVTNVPTSDDYYVETIVYDASNALQKAYNYTDGTSYVRVKNAATWGNWKQITNA